MNPTPTWQVKELQELADVDREMLGSGTDPTYAFHYIDISSVAEGSITIPSQTTTFRVAPSRARKVLHPKDVLMSTVRPNLKAFALFNHVADACVASTAFAVLTARGSDPRFLLYAILSDPVTTQIEGLVAGSNYPAISTDKVRCLKILTPSYPVQGAIAEVLSTVDRAIEQTEALVAKQKRIRTGLMQDLFTRGIDNDGRLRSGHTHTFKDSVVGRIPADWNVFTIGDLSELTNGNSFSSKDWREQGLPIIRIQNLNGETEFRYYDGPVSEKWRVRPGELLFAWAGQRNSSFGPRLWRGPEGVLNQHIFRVQPNEEILCKAFLNVLLSFNLTRIEDCAHGFKQSFLHVPKGDLVAVQVAVPPRNEQTKLLEVLSEHGELLAGTQATLNKLRSLKTALMQDLLTGRKPVTPLLTPTEDTPDERRTSPEEPEA